LANIPTIITPQN